MTMGLNDDMTWVWLNMVNLNVTDFGKWYEWNGLWSEENEWDGLWSQWIRMKCDRWSCWCDKRGFEVNWLCGYVIIFQLTYKINITIFVCLFVFVKLLNLFYFQTQLKAPINICKHSSIYLFGFFETCPDRVTLVSLGAMGFNGLIVVNEVMGFGKLTVYGGVILSGDLVVGGTVFLTQIISCQQKNANVKVVNGFHVGKNKIRIGNFQKLYL